MCFLYKPVPVSVKTSVSRSFQSSVPVPIFILIPHHSVLLSSKIILVFVISKEAVIQGTFYGLGTAVQGVGVDHGGADVAVAQEFLYGADVVSVFQKMSGKGVSEGVTAGVFYNACFPDCIFYGFLQNAFVNVMPPLLACRRAVQLAPDSLWRRLHVPLLRRISFDICMWE